MTRFERWSVMLTSLATVLTGIGYYLVKYLMETPDPWAVANHPLQPWLLKAHILVAPLMVFSVGMIMVRHVWRHFRGGMRWARRSGLTLMLSLAPMVLSGYLIQAITHTGWLRAMAWSHIGLGMLYALGMALHFRAIRRQPPRDRIFRQTRRVRIPSARAHAHGR